MKTITFNCNIQVDLNNGNEVARVVEIINLELQRTSLDSAPQILPDSVNVVYEESEIGFFDLTDCTEETKHKFLALSEEDKQDIYDSYDEAISQSGDPNYKTFGEYLEDEVDFDAIGQFE
jgi:hypothetical protein